MYSPKSVFVKFETSKVPFSRTRNRLASSFNADDHGEADANEGERDLWYPKVFFSGVSQEIIGQVSPCL